jgi:hypothetical protein
MIRKGKAYKPPSKVWLGELAAIANVKPDYAEYFYIQVVSLLKEQWRNADWRTSSPAVLDAQKKIFAARNAFNKLSDREQECLAQLVIARKFADVVRGSFDCPAVRDWDLILLAMGEAIVGMTGKDPGPPFREHHGRGRPSASVANLPFQLLVESLLYLVATYGGRMTFDAKDGGRGSLFRVLNHLRPVLPPDLVPKFLPLKTVERTMSKKSFDGPFIGPYPPPRKF